MSGPRALFNGSVIQFDPYRNQVLDIFTFPGITETNIEHASGIDWNPHDGLLSIVIDADPAFLTDGADVSGTYWLLKFDPVAKREVWRANLTELTHGRWGGFQGVTTDAAGNTYVAGTYPKSIVRVSADGAMDVWYPPQTANTTVHGYTGIASTGHTVLVVDNQGVPEESSTGNAAIFRFDMRAEHPSPVRVPLTPATPPLGLSDSIHLPPRFAGTVMLVSLDLIGVTVLRTRDGWRTAEQLGTIVSDFGLANARDLPATVQIGDRKLFMIGEYFPGEFVPGTTAGNRSDFSMFDITAQVEALLAK